jgi:glycosyltransferase involved in cell wall biosynthesis
MNVLLMTSHLRIGGITSYITMVATGLRARGHRVWVAAGGGPLAEQLRRQGVSVVHVPVHTKSVLHPKLWWATRRLRKLIREEHIDVIHAQTRVTQWIAMRLTQRGGPPLVTTWHGFFRPHLGRRLWPCMGDRVIAISPPVAQHLVQDFRVAPEHMVLIEHGIPMDQFQAPTPEIVRTLRAEFGFPQDAFIVGTVARLVPDKGIDTLARAMARLVNTYPQLRCLIIGSGPEEDRLQQLVKELMLTDRIVFMHSQVELHVPLSVLDCFALPVRGHEGFGLVLVEAMAMEIPVIASTQPALRYILDDGAAGLLVPPEDAAALAQAIAQLIDDPMAAEQLGLRGYARVQQAFSLSRMIDTLEEVYHHVIQEHHASITRHP